MKKITITIFRMYIIMKIKLNTLIYTIKVKFAEICEMIDQNSGQSKIASRFLLPALVTLFYSVTMLHMVDYIMEETPTERAYLSMKEAQSASEKLGFGITAQDKTGEYIDSSEIHAERIIQELAEQNLREQEIQSVIMYAESGATEDELRAYIRAHTLIDSSEKLIAAMRLRAETRAAPPPATRPAPRSAPVMIRGNKVQAPVVASPTPPVVTAAPKVQAAAPPSKPVTSSQVTSSPNEVVVVVTEMESNQTRFPAHYFYWAENNLYRRERAEIEEMFFKVFRDDDNMSLSHMKTCLLFWYHQEFIEYVAREAGYRPAVVAAMFYIEAFSRHKGSDLLTEANNPGGIKKRPGIGDDTVHYRDDCYDAKGKEQTCRFASFKTVERGGKWWASVLDAPRYDPAQEADRRGESYYNVFQGFKQGGYWTATGSGPINSRAEYARLYERSLELRITK